MPKDTGKRLEMPQMPDVADSEAFMGIVRSMYLDWLRFFRDNMACGWQCPGNCGLPEDCDKIERVWQMWLEGLEVRAIAITN